MRTSESREGCDGSDGIEGWDRGRDVCDGIEGGMYVMG